MECEKWEALGERNVGKTRRVRLTVLKVTRERWKGDLGVNNLFVIQVNGVIQK